jgi:penicillin-binding protein 2
MSTRFTLKDPAHESRLINDRLIFAAIFVGILFSVVMVRLAILQVVEHEHFDFLSNRNRVDI